MGGRYERLPDARSAFGAARPRGAQGTRAVMMGGAHDVEHTPRNDGGLRQQGWPAAGAGIVRAPNRQTGGHWFEPGTAHSEEALVARGSRRS